MIKVPPDTRQIEIFLHFTILCFHLNGCSNLRRVQFDSCEGANLTFQGYVPRIRNRFELQQLRGRAEHSLDVLLWSE